MLNWKAHPFLRLLIPLVFGIVLGNQLRLTPEWWWLFLPVSFLFILFRFVWFSMAYHHRRLYGIIANMFFIIFGFLLTSFFPETLQNQHFSHHIQKNDVLIGKVVQPPTKKKRLSAVIAIHKLVRDKRTISVLGHLYGSFPDTSNIQYGQVIALNVYPQKFQGSRNPYAFDFRRWQYYQNVHFQAFVKPKNYQLLESSQGVWLLSIAYDLRKKSQFVLRRVIKNTRDLGIASALVLGVKDDLSDETKNAFSSTGAMHVLAVSGLHVGIVSFGLRWLLVGVFGRRVSRRWYRLIVQLLGVWFFVLLTGAGASVLRAGVMFSIVEIGLALDRRTSIFNSIAASAFILLVWNPFLLFQVGFQLSYLALTGIVFFQPYLYNLPVFKSNIFNFIWTLSTVSMAAQITTFPLSIYYFHQFPLSFLLSGLVVVPAATLLLPFTIFVIIIDFVAPFVADFLGVALSFLFSINSTVVFWLSEIKWMKMNELFFSELTVLLSFALIFTLGYWLKTHRKKMIFYAFFFLAMLSVERNILSFRAEHRQALVFFSLYKVDAFGFIDGRSILCFKSDTIAPKKWKFTSKPLLIHHGIYEEITLPKDGNYVVEKVMKSNNYWKFNGSVLSHVFKNISNPIVKADIVFISENIENSKWKKMKPKTIVLGTKVASFKADEIKKFFLNKGVNVHHLKNGGLVLNLKN